MLHILFLSALALLVLPLRLREEPAELIVSTIAESEPIEFQHEVQLLPKQLAELESDSLWRPTGSDAMDDLAAPSDVRIDLPELARAREVDVRIDPRAAIAANLAGRGRHARAALVQSFGGTPESEAAVARGLRWLARHQDADGSWSFDHVRDACGEDCSTPGTMDDCRVGATAMAVLAFLGAGQSHREGDYQPQVGAALAYLQNSMQIGPRGGDLRAHVPHNAGMYVQGLATMALSEAWVLTGDESLKQAAQFAVNYIASAQDPDGGGWRYQPQQRGDTSVVGWQILALTSARIGELKIPSRTWKRASRFLDSVQSYRGAYYGYSSPGNRPSMTAVGLLCRMYLGWRRDNPALERGIRFLDKRGPSPADMYYNYYATQVLHHWGGEPWRRWNEAMRNQLVAAQRRDGHTSGSWDVTDPHGKAGGRLYMTSLCIMTLEVYYRHLPLYQHVALPEG